MSEPGAEAAASRRLVGELAPRLCNWDRWDPADGLGLLNLVDEGKRLEGRDAIRTGQAISLGFELREGCRSRPARGGSIPST